MWRTLAVLIMLVEICIQEVPEVNITFWDKEQELLNDPDGKIARENAERKAKEKKETEEKAGFWAEK